MNLFVRIKKEREGWRERCQRERETEREGRKKQVKKWTDSKIKFSLVFSQMCDPRVASDSLTVSVAVIVNKKRLSKLSSRQIQTGFF